MNNNATMRRLGDYIRQVDARNRDLKVTRLVGVNLDKEFMPSVANTVGTDMATYKIVSYNQFGCKLMSVERDRKMPISLMKDQEPALISSAYYVFEVLDENILDPDFLFLQIKSPEFDRRLWFSSGGDVRGGVGFDNLADMPISVPPIEEQREIVARHKAIEHKIDVNRRLIAKLEETARTIYRHTFVEDIDPENLPTGWRMGTLGEICDIKGGKRMPSDSELVSTKTKHPYIKIADMSLDRFVMLNDNFEFIPDEETFSCISRYIVNKNDIILSIVGSIGLCSIIDSSLDNANLTENCVKLKTKVSAINLYIYNYLTSEQGQRAIEEATVGAVQKKLPIYNILALPLLIPDLDTIKGFNKELEPISNYIKTLQRQIIRIKQTYIL